MLESSTIVFIRFWGNLEEGLMTGQATNEAKRRRFVCKLSTSKYGQIKRVYPWMGSIQMGNFMAFAQALTFKMLKHWLISEAQEPMLSLMVAKPSAST